MFNFIIWERSQNFDGYERSAGFSRRVDAENYLNLPYVTDAVLVEGPGRYRKIDKV